MKNRRFTLMAAATLMAVTALTALPAKAQPAGKVKVGLMLPYTGTFAALGTAIENGFRLYVTEQGGKLGGRLNAVKGDVSKKAEFATALRTARIDSPRGTFTLSKSHNPVQDIYLHQVGAKENKLIGVASKGLTDPGRGCRM